MKFLARSVCDANRQTDVNRAGQEAQERIQENPQRFAVEGTIQKVGLVVF